MQPDKASWNCTQVQVPAEILIPLLRNCCMSLGDGHLADTTIHRGLSAQSYRGNVTGRGFSPAVRSTGEPVEPTPLLQRSIMQGGWVWAAKLRKLDLKGLGQQPKFGKRGWSTWAWWQECEVTNWCTAKSRGITKGIEGETNFIHQA